jgi:hypothetical protein
MRAKLKILVAAAAGLLIAPQLAMADDVEEQLKLMNERMGQLENQLQATQDQLDSSQEQVSRQQGVIEKAGLDRQAESGLSGFYNSVEISGWVAASWFWNFNDPRDQTIRDQNLGRNVFWTDSAINSGHNGALYPFHPDHNSFSVDQLWFEIEKPVTEESRGGFRADMVYGKTASLLSAWGQHRECGARVPDDVVDSEEWDVECKGDSSSDFYLYQAYAQYLTPFGPTLKAGKFETWTGAESAATTRNFNISRGLVYSLMQPITHYGVTLDGDVNGIVYGVGVVNSIFSVDPDFNNSKTLIAKGGYAGETFSSVASILYGDEITNESSGPSKGLGVLDWTTTWDPTESFSSWLDFTYNWVSDNPSGDALRAWGIALAGRYAFTDRLGLALRGEFAQDHGMLLGFDDSGVDADIWEVTMTLDYELTDNLIAKVEARYDWIDWIDPDGAPHPDSDEFVGHENDDFFDCCDTFTNRDQWTTAVELTYMF